MCHSNLQNHQVGRLASPIRRLGAYLLDIAIPVTAFLTLLGVAGAGVATGSESGAGIGTLLAFCLFIGYTVWALTLFSRGTTPGKSILGMRVVKESGASAGFGTMLLREWIGKLISGMVFSLGFLWILIDRDRQGWHDKLVTTYVVTNDTAGVVAV